MGLLAILAVFAVPFVAFAGPAAPSVDRKPELTNDGLEFSINRKDFKVAQFELYGRTFDDNYGFTDNSLLPLDNRGYAEVRCDVMHLFLLQ
jgi:hypothetical protein